MTSIGPAQSKIGPKPWTLFRPGEVRDTRRSCLQAIHDEARACLWHQLDQRHPAAIGFDEVAPDDLIDAVVGALDQNIGLDAGDEVERRVFAKQHDSIDKSEPGENDGAGRLALDRTLRALETPHRSVVVEADHELVATRAGLAQQMNVPGMEKVEA